MPTRVKVTALTASATVGERTSTMKYRPRMRPRTVARSPGPQPLNAEAIRIAGRKNRYEASPRSTDIRASLTASANAIAAMAMPYCRIVREAEIFNRCPGR